MILLTELLRMSVVAFRGFHSSFDFKLNMAIMRATLVEPSGQPEVAEALDIDGVGVGGSPTVRADGKVLEVG